MSFIKSLVIFSLLAISYFEALQLTNEQLSTLANAGIPLASIAPGLRDRECCSIPNEDLFEYVKFTRVEPYTVTETFTELYYCGKRDETNGVRGVTNGMIISCSKYRVAYRTVTYTRIVEYYETRPKPCPADRMICCINNGILYISGMCITQEFAVTNTDLIMGLIMGGK